MNRGPQVPAAMAAAIICLAVGAAAGYYARYMTETPHAGGSGGSSSGGSMGSGGMMGRMGSGGGMGGGMMGGMGGGQPQNGMTLARTVRNLAVVEKAQSHALTAQQAAALAPILESLKSAETLPDKGAEAKLADVNKVLTDDQKKLLDEMSPPRGGFGGGRGGPGGPGGSGGMMGSGGPRMAGGPPMPGGSGGASGGTPSYAPMAAMMGGGGRPDPEKPFATERNKQALDDLIAAVKNPGGGSAAAH